MSSKKSVDKKYVEERLTQIIRNIVVPRLTVCSGISSDNVLFYCDTLHRVFFQYYITTVYARWFVNPSDIKITDMMKFQNHVARASTLYDPQFVDSVTNIPSLLPAATKKYKAWYQTLTKKVDQLNKTIQAVRDRLYLGDNCDLIKELETLEKYGMNNHE